MSNTARTPFDGIVRGKNTPLFVRRSAAQNVAAEVC